MLLELKRFEKAANGKATIGHLFVDGQLECFILEDTVREVAGQPVLEWKIAGETAIPTGTYEVVIDASGRFSQLASIRLGRQVNIYTPHLLNVPGFSGVRIHPGTTDLDTEGCLLPGKWHNLGEDKITGSRIAYMELLPKLEAALCLQRVYDGDPWKDQTQSPLVCPWHYDTIAGTPDKITIQVVNDFFAPTATPSAG